MNKKEALECIKNEEYESVPKEFYKDKSIVLEAVKSNGFALEYTDESFKKDKSIVLEAVKQNGVALEYADESFKKDKSIVLEAVKKNGWALEYVGKVMTGTWYLRTEISNVHPVTVNFYRENSNQDS
jgi:serine/threonine-protein kinase TTK/MPS1